MGVSRKDSQRLKLTDSRQNKKSQQKLPFKLQELGRRLAKRSSFCGKNNTKHAKVAPKKTPRAPKPPPSLLRQNTQTAVKLRTTIFSR